jgi:hypothetical protein
MPSLVCELISCDSLHLIYLITRTVHERDGTNLAPGAGAGSRGWFTDEYLGALLVNEGQPTGRGCSAIWKFQDLGGRLRCSRPANDTCPL